MAKLNLRKGKRQRLSTGSIFSIDLHNGDFAFGRCILKVSIGHLVEVFDCFSDQGNFEFLTSERRLFDPIIIDSYMLINREMKEGNWSVIGKDKDYTPKEIDHLRFAYGTGPDRFLTDVWGNETTITKKEAETYPVYSPKGDIDVVEMILAARKESN